MPKAYTPTRGIFEGRTFRSQYQYRIARDAALGRVSLGERRSAAARARGFTGYGQERKARAQISASIRSKIARGLDAKLPDPRDPTFDLLLRARAEIIKASKTFERGNLKLSPELKAELRKAFTDDEGNLDVGGYWSAVKSLYD